MTQVPMVQFDWETVYRSSMYAFREASGNWYRFSLNGTPGSLPQEVVGPLREHGSLLLITAWNPMSEQLSRSVNEEANAALRERLEGSGFPFDQSYGGSLPGVEPGWREDGFVVFGMSRQKALEWGRSLQQRSLVWAKDDAIGLLFCSDGRFVACGVQGPADDG